ncbi:SDR family NAD(P)-dependent oxidoreductase [Aquirufa rosea]|uniref:SDR family oxidoreductase n=1 Tax=Aquirufa rosea TaxID=2509241 RepID=A0A4Q1C2F8_9BACT|nr:SDR family oxidoreductase [Aquirufa rosea]RXK52295.1 SDR family oxidoreductase [Aquirufa rosea]
MLKYIVTGAAQGIGFEIVKSILLQGDYVIWNDVNQEHIDKAQAQLHHQGLYQFSSICADASSDDFLESLSHLIDQTPGTLAGCVCNAGITTFGDFWSYTKESLDQILKINIKGTFFLAQLVAKKLRDADLGGSILLMSSVTGHIAHPDLAAYGMTKAALNQLAKNLVIDLSPYQIRINTISPGATLTERTLSDQDYRREWSSITPMGCPATVEDIAQAALFFLSPKSKHVTGQSLVIDGGWTSVGIPPK